MKTLKLQNYGTEKRDKSRLSLPYESRGELELILAHENDVRKTDLETYERLELRNINEPMLFASYFTGY